MSNLKTAKAPSFKAERRTHSHIIMLSNDLFVVRMQIEAIMWENTRYYDDLISRLAKHMHTHLHIMYYSTKKITRLWAETEVESKTQKPHFIWVHLSWVQYENELILVIFVGLRWAMIT